MPRKTRRTGVRILRFLGVCLAMAPMVAGTQERGTNTPAAPVRAPVRIRAGLGTPAVAQPEPESVASGRVPGAAPRISFEGIAPAPDVRPPSAPEPQTGLTLVQAKPKPALPTPPKLPTPPPLDAARTPAKGDIEDTSIQINTRTPTPSELFRLETAQQFQERLRKEMERLKHDVQLPEISQGRGTLLQDRRGWLALTEGIEPHRLCFGRLHFRPRADERYSRELGHLQPMVSTGFFYYDLTKLPVSVMSHLCDWVECDDHRDLEHHVRHLPTETWSGHGAHD